MLFVQFTHTLMCIIIWLHTCDCKTSEYFIMVLDGYGTACIYWNTCLEQKTLKYVDTGKMYRCQWITLLQVINDKILNMHVYMLISN